MRILAILITLTVTATTLGQQIPEQSSSDIQSQVAETQVIRKVLVPAREPGILTKLHVREGDYVQEGQELAKLDRRLFELEREIAQLRLNVAELKASDDVDYRFAIKSQAVAEKTYERSSSAVEQYEKAVSKTELAKLKLDAERAELSIEKAEFDRTTAEAEAALGTQEVGAASLKLAHRDIVSPISGVVVQVFPQEDEWVRSGEPLVRIIQLDTIRVVGVFPASAVNRSLVGKKAIFESSINPGVEFMGEITFVSPEILRNNGVVVWIDVANKDQKLRAGEPGSVRIPVSQ